MVYITPLEKAHADANHVFHDLFPANGFVVRPAQIGLCHEILNALFSEKIALCDAGIGVGKTCAYLVAGLLWQKYSPNNLPRTLTVSTSSVALQSAVLKDYLPFLSRTFVQNGILAKPIRAVVRKGRERYVCDRRLSERGAQIRDSKKISAERKAALERLQKNIDLDEAVGLSAYDRAHVCVPIDCSHSCPLYAVCRYQAHLKRSRDEDVDTQICNHNFLLADAIHRQQEMRPLLKDYHVLIVDEAHKLPETARQMYAQRYSVNDTSAVCEQLAKVGLTQMARKMYAAWDTLANTLLTRERGIFIPAQETLSALETLIYRLRHAARPAFALPRNVAESLLKKAEVLTLFMKPDGKYTLCVQQDKQGKPMLCVFNRHLSQHLTRDLWQHCGTAILASGTLAAGGSFACVRQQMGLEQSGRCREFTALSPFDYENNGLIYLPPGKEQKDKSAVPLSQSIQELILAAYGHTLILFTSYTFMSSVCRTLRGTIPYPLFQAWRGNQYAVAQFKAAPNGVLCAAGACWEGVDFPGDEVSLLIIVHLPFPAPAPVSRLEQEQYPSLQEYIHTVVVPKMQTKLRQGVGRAIRTEADTCAIAILDKRAVSGGRYHDAVLKALPPCPVTDKIEDVGLFIHNRKGPEYFARKGGLST